MRVLVTGGAGYIGSHAAVALLAAGHEVIIVDNFANSSREAIRRVESITGKTVVFYELDICDAAALNSVFERHTIDAVIHFAGLKAVGESVRQPLAYYRNNIDSSLTLLECMATHDVHKLVFSSSATVYGMQSSVRYVETMTVGPGISSPYGKTKYMVEQIIEDAGAADPALCAVSLRYFNPIGAHPSGLIGEDPLGVPNNLMPFVAQVAAGRRPKLSVFGDDYPTPDGTARRDYIHVVDLAMGHLAALEHLSPGVTAYNLGSGKPTSVLELVNAFVAVTGQPVAYEIAPRRDGDLPEFYADPTKATHDLGWQTERDIADMCRDTWNWQHRNPEGYKQAKGAAS